MPNPWIERIHSEFGLIEIVDESAYRFSSGDNLCTYPFEKMLSDRSLITSIHGIILDGKLVAVLGASGGGSTVHDHSAILVNGSLYLAVGNQVACICPKPFRFRWAVQIDTATCFGVYFDPNHSALLSHGELEISRYSEEGQILWSVSGADAFSEGFELLPNCIRVTDFNGKRYCFDYETGKADRTSAPVSIAARLSWMLPLAAWASQILSGILLGKRAPAEFWLVLIILQGLAIIAGLALGISALISMARRRNWQDKRQAIRGCLFSAITIVIILLAFLLL